MKKNEVTVWDTAIAESYFETTQKVVYHLLSILFIFLKLFVNDKQTPRIILKLQPSTLFLASHRTRVVKTSSRTILKLHPSTLFLASPTTRAVKTSILKWIRVFSNFVAFIPICWNCQMWANFPGVDFLGTALKFRKRKKIRRRFLTSSIKRQVS